MALFLTLTAPGVLWRFLDVRLAHSPSLLPLLLASVDLKRAGCRVVIAVRRWGRGAPSPVSRWSTSAPPPVSTLDGLADLLESCSIPTEMCYFSPAGGAGDGGLPAEPADGCFYVLAVEGRETVADILSASPQWLNGSWADRMMLILDQSAHCVMGSPQGLDSTQGLAAQGAETWPGHQPPSVLQALNALQLTEREGILEELLEVLGTKLGHFLRVHLAESRARPPPRPTQGRAVVPPQALPPST